MLQKIIQVGNSLAITIPRELIEKFPYKKGEEVLVETETSSGTLLMKPKKGASKVSLSPEFYAWLDEVGKKYEDVIKELAHR